MPRRNVSKFVKFIFTGRVGFVVLTIAIEAVIMYIIWYSILGDSNTAEKCSCQNIPNINQSPNIASPPSISSGSEINTATGTTKKPSESTSIITMTTTVQQKKNGSRLFCWIMTSKNHYESRTKYLEEIWPKRCDEHFFFTDDSTNRTDRYKDVFATLPDGHDKLWNRTKAAMRFIYANYLNDYDWFFKVDDDTYVIVENLRKLLNRTDHHYFGYKWQHEIWTGFHSGGSGYVLSRTTYKLLVDSLSNKNICGEGWAEDVEVGKCLHNLGIDPELVMQNGTNLFFPVHLTEYKMMGKVGEEKVNSDLISMHYLNPKEMRLIDFFIYRFRLEPPWYR